MFNTENSRNRPEGIRRIYEAASKLVMPSLPPLYQVFLDEKAGVQAQRNELLRKQEELRQEGMEAAVRLMISGSDEFRIERRSYFEQIEQKRKEGKK